MLANWNMITCLVLGCLCFWGLIYVDVDAGYSLRQIHQSRVEQKLEAIEKAVSTFNFPFAHTLTVMITELIV